MVSVNVSQLLLLGPGAVREFDFDEPLPNPADEVRLRGPISGHARLTRIPEGILVHSEHAAWVELECARCLDETAVHVEGEFDEEFLPSTDIRTGAPLPVPDEPDLAFIDEHNEIDLDEILRQNILTNLPFRPLCSATCPGLCATCGVRLDDHHRPHPERDEVDADAPVEATSPFARLAVLLRNNEER